MLALLRHDGDTNTVRRLCEEEIPDFLKEGELPVPLGSSPINRFYSVDTSVFVQDVFNAIQYRSYLPNAPPAPSLSTLFSAPTGASAPLLPGLGVEGAPRGPQSNLRKRSFHDDLTGPAGGQDFQYNGSDARAFKQMRRGGGSAGAGGRLDNGFAGGRGGRHEPAPMNLPQMPAGMPPLDPNNPMAAILAMQAMGFPVPGMPGFPSAPSPTGFQSGAEKSPRMAGPGNARKGRCQDYDTKGFCALGNSCPFEHGTDSIYVPPGGNEGMSTFIFLELGVVEVTGASI